ncbi:MAG: acyl-CoA dehydrogenase C-terminal domain-containing protein, partial [Hydrogenophaga sp.]|nr:acyl-CoA dehydrogenase C-terminal domain-containing protein [Hydrogenophaga sp.]
DVALAAHAAADTPARTGRLGAMRFFFHYELPKIGAWLQVVSHRDPTCANLPEEAF